MVAKSKSEFHVCPLQPKIIFFQPNIGSPGKEVTVYGVNFDGVIPKNNVIIFNDVIANTIISATETEVHVLVPPMATTGPITVRTSGGEAKGEDEFEVTSPVGHNIGMFFNKRVVVFPSILEGPKNAYAAEVETPARNVKLFYNVRPLSEEEKRSKRTSNAHEFFVFLKASEVPLKAVKSVTYHLHPTFKPPVVRVTSRSNNFGLTLTAWGQFTIGAEVHFYDGQVIRLSKYLSFQGEEPSLSKDYQVGLDNTATPLFVKGDTQWYRFTLYVDALPKIISKILYVEYHLHEKTFDPPNRIGSNQGKKFAVNWVGWGIFEVKADIHFKDGSVDTVPYMLSVKESNPL